jgi:di/tricarboxylate transporter
MAIVVGHGAVAGGMSPFAVTGIIANGLMERMGWPGYEWQTFSYNLAANVLVALVGYICLGGWRLLLRNAGGSTEPVVPDAVSFERRHLLSLVVVALLIAGVLFLKVHVGMAAFGAAAVLFLARAADEKETIRAMPWSVILMVCGVTVLTSMIEQAGGIDRLTDVIASVSTIRSIPAVLAFTTGVLSVYSSTSGVILPAFLPAVPSLVEKLGAGEPVALASSINIGGNLVDVSPLSTIGALCIACAAPSEDRRLLFHKLLAWGLSMSLIAALLCTLFFAL